MSPTIISSTDSVLQGSWNVPTTLPQISLFANSWDVCVCVVFFCFNTVSDTTSDVHYWIRYKQRSSLNFSHLYYVPQNSILMRRNYRQKQPNCLKTLHGILSIYCITMSTRKKYPWKRFFCIVDETNLWKDIFRSFNQLDCVDLFCIENACHCVVFNLWFGCSNILLSVSLSVCFRMYPFYLI